MSTNTSRIQGRGMTGSNVVRLIGFGTFISMGTGYMIESMNEPSLFSSSSLDVI